MQTIIVHGEPVIITDETIKAACQWWADNCQGCIDEAVSGKVRVNNLGQYVKDKEREKQEWLASEGKQERSLAFWQKAYYIQTGNSVSIL